MPCSIPEVLAGLNGTPPSFAEMLERLYQGRFRGRVLLHFDEGLPKVVEFSSPIQVTLAEAFQGARRDHP